METLKFWLAALLKRSSSQSKSSSGFTLIELLVAVIVAVIVITPLLGFMINILQTDYREQAKISSEEELQAATNYIARDLQQAVYIYNADGIAKLTGNYSTTLCASSTATSCSQIPTATDRVPVLVFWKRKLIEDSIPLNPSQDCTTGSDLPAACQKNDGFVYSLVAYYLINDDDNTWSETSRIARFEIQDGVKKTNGDYVRESHTKVGRSAGFAPFDLSGKQALQEKMNNWKKASGQSYNVSPVVLVDYIDQSTGVSAEACPGTTGWQQTPAYPSTLPTGYFNYKTHSFYACVNTTDNTARVYLRGNALARIPYSGSVPAFSSEQSAFFPRTKIEVKGISRLQG